MVERLTLPDGSEVWHVSGYATVRAALADPRLSLDKAHAKAWTGFALPPALDANLLNMDPPDHTRIRSLVSQAFTPRRVEQLRPFVQRVADELLDAVAGDGRADLIAAYAGPLPVIVIGELLGVPADAGARFRELTSTLLNPPSREAAAGAITGIQRFITDLIRRRRTDPGGDLLSAMIAARDADDRLTEDELTSLAFLILIAGHETTVNLIGNAVHLLLTHPDRLAEARCEPESLPAVVEEVLRVAPPTPVAFRRFPVEDVELDGVRIPAGDTVLLSIAGANRDPARFDRPEVFDPARTDGGHVALGHGIHYCIGAPLARLEGEIALRTLLRRLPRLALAVPEAQLRWSPSFRTRGLLELPVAY
ncbi:cytochrome P450 [Catellatospora sp. NPDC049609]|uniref:cytochrome P450 family protein n=1 Tax=Catellatospora sp. NPDC049609 TaxID=3155505 RepID=UPI003419A4DD